MFRNSSVGRFFLRPITKAFSMSQDQPFPTGDLSESENLVFFQFLG